METIKEEKKADLEQLLNSLIEKGWKPFGRNYGVVDFLGTLVFVDLNDGRLQSKNALDLRKLTSKESGLWQFVCDREHRFIDKKNYEGVRSDRRLKNPYVDYDGVNTEYEWITSLDYQFWLMESALKNESELEDFLLNSIKLD